MIEEDATYEIRFWFTLSEDYKHHFYTLYFSDPMIARECAEKISTAAKSRTEHCPVLEEYALMDGTITTFEGLFAAIKIRVL